MEVEKKEERQPNSVQDDAGCGENALVGCDVGHDAGGEAPIGSN